MIPTSNKSRQLQMSRRFRVIASWLIGIGLLVTVVVFSVVLYHKRGLVSELAYIEKDGWRTFPVGCFVVQVPDAFSVVKITIANEETWYSLTPAIRTDKDWDDFAEEWHESPGWIRVQIGEAELADGEQIVIGGMPGVWQETVEDNLYSAVIQITSPIPLFYGRLILIAGYDGLTLEERQVFLDILKTIRFDQTLYGGSGNRTFVDEAADLEVDDWAMELSPVTVIALDQRWKWTNYNLLDCVFLGESIPSGPRMGRIL